MASVYERFATAADLTNKLQGVVAKYKDEWIWTSHISATGRMEYYVIADQTGPDFEVKNIDLTRVDEDDLNYKDFQLGYCVSDGTLFYVSRYPLRKYKFGLRDDNTEFTPIPGNPDVPRDIRGKGNREFARTIQNGSLRQTLRGQYMPFKSAVQELKEGKLNAIPFDREFAVVRATMRMASIYYKTDPIGEFDLKTGEIELYPSYNHMFERLDALKTGKVSKYRGE